MTPSAPMPRRHLLPPQSTALERAVDETSPAWDGIAAAFTPPSVGEPATFAPWLAAEYELAEFAPYFEGTAELIANGLRWLFERGTAASVLRALSWVGFPDARVEEDGPYLHIHTGRIPTDAEIAHLAHVVRASIPAHVSLYRAVHGLDLRPLVLDRGRALDAGMLDGYSGVMGDSGVVLSFGQRRGSLLPSSPVGTPQGSTEQTRVSVSRYDDMPLLDAWRLDSRVLAGVSGGVMEISIHASEAPQPGGGTSGEEATRAGLSAWTAPDPIGARIEARTHYAPIPVHPPRRWGGPWGGPWRPNFYFISREE